MTGNILHKYIKYQYGFDILNKLRIKVDKPSNFNDPFELIPAVIDVSPDNIYNAVLSNEDYLMYFYSLAVSQGKTGESYELFKRRINSSTGKNGFLQNVKGMADTLRNRCRLLKNETDKVALMTCFCGETGKENPHEILMWSHYADAHKGLRISFNKNLMTVQGTSFLKIKYMPDRIVLNPLHYFKDGNQYLNETYHRMLSAKSSIWFYENEFRLLVSTQLCQKEQEYMFMPINSNAIVEVVLGVESTLEQIELIKKVVNEKFSGVKVKKAEIDDYKFKLNYF